MLKLLLLLDRFSFELVNLTTLDALKRLNFDEFCMFLRVFLKYTEERVGKISFDLFALVSDTFVEFNKLLQTESVGINQLYKLF